MLALRFHRTLNALGALIVLCILGVALTMLWTDRQTDWNRSAQSARNIVVTLEEDISRSMQLYDVTLMSVAQSLRTPGFEHAGPALRQQLLFATAAVTEHLGSILVLDTEGNIRFDSGSIVPRQGNFADRDYFMAHKARADVGLFVSVPYKSRLRGGDPSIGLSRRLFNPDGSFAGVVLGAMRLSYMQEKFAGLALGEGDAIGLMRSDGIMLMRRPYVASEIGRDMSRTTTFRRISSEGVGSFVSRAATDNVERLFTFSAVRGFPLILNLGLSVDEIMSPWRIKTMVLGPITLILCVAVGALTMLFQRELRRRRLIQAELDVLARTDGLTSLANRRRFDEVMAMEWERAARRQSPLSILFIDADNFKLFNDRYGHRAGDDLLRRMADAIAQNTGDDHTFVARYGGEEFVVILPDTSAEDAVPIAHRIGNAVAALGIAHPDGVGGIATVSVGVAGATPDRTQGFHQLIERADAALYRAKGAGRARVDVA